MYLLYIIDFFYFYVRVIEHNFSIAYVGEIVSYGFFYDGETQSCVWANEIIYFSRHPWRVTRARVLTSYLYIVILK